jgi:hypothetical protein
VETGAIGKDKGFIKEAEKTNCTNATGEALSASNQLSA